MYEQIYITFELTSGCSSLCAWRFFITYMISI